MFSARNFMLPSLHMKKNTARMCRVFGMLCSAALIGGCASVIAPKIVAPQRDSFLQDLAGKNRAASEFFQEDLDAYIAERRMVAVGPPPARLAVAVIPPGRYSMTFGKTDGGRCETTNFTGHAQRTLLASQGRVWRMQWLREHHMTNAQAKALAARRQVVISFLPGAVPAAILQRYRASIAELRSTQPPKGTVILLPGDGNGMFSMLPWALLLGRAGYQSILVDLRAQGRSTGRYVTYGAIESKDLVQLVTALRAQGLIRGRLGLLGDSLGAATALLAAPHLAHLAAVVAISPYARATSVIPRFADHFIWYAHFIPASSWRAAERAAGRMAGVSLADAAPIKAVADIRAPVLYLQGGADQIIGSKAAHELAARTPDSELSMYPGLGHVRMALAYRQLAHPILGWFKRYLAKSDRPVRPLAAKVMPPHYTVLTFKVCGG